MTTKPLMANFQLSSIEDFLDKLQGVKQCGRGHVAFCPGHDDQHNKSLSITEASDRVLINCMTGCSAENVVSAMGLTLADLFKHEGWPGFVKTPYSGNGNGGGDWQVIAEYEYRDLDGNLVSKSVKYRMANASKSYAQCHPWNANDDTRLKDAQTAVSLATGQAEQKLSKRVNQLLRWRRKGWAWDLEDVKRIPYRLAEFKAADPAEMRLIPEGEKCVEAIRAIGGSSTCNPCGALKWPVDQVFNSHFKGLDCVVLADDDPANAKTGLVPGMTHANMVCDNLLKAGAARVRLVKPFSDNPPRKRDIDDYIQGLTGCNADKLDALMALCDTVPDWTMPATGVEVRTQVTAQVTQPASKADSAATGEGAELLDFYAFMENHQYVNCHTRAFWPATSVDSQVKPIPTGNKKRDSKGVVTDEDEYIPAHAWLDRERHVEQMAWAPGEPEVIKGRVVSDGGWSDHKGYSTFNLYKPAQPAKGDASKVQPWLDHVRRVYPDDTNHIIKWLAERVQHPEVKINHGLVLGGKQGIGKDMMLEPVKRAVGPWNFVEISPAHLTGTFNGFVKSVILRISEARDLGDVDRYSFYEHCKIYLASPPDVLRCNEKHLREVAVFNVCGVIITTNHKTDGIYLPKDDRRHYVAWSEASPEDFRQPDGSDYWTTLVNWYETGGYGNVAAYLATLDLADFNPKAPPKKTTAFWAIVDSSRSSEDSELSDILDRLGTVDPADPQAIIPPAAVTLKMIADEAGNDITFTAFAEWLSDRKNKRQIPHRLESAGYVAVRNPTSPSDGRWKIDGRRCVIYARATLTESERIAAAGKLS